MIEKEVRNLLFQKMNIYLTNDNPDYDSSQMIDTIISLIVDFFDCDMKKMIAALDLFISNKETGNDVKFADYYNKVDVSKFSNLSVKGFLSKGNPMLFFYLGDEASPFAKVKKTIEDGKDKFFIEISNSSEVLEKYKKGGKFNNAYVADYEFVYDGKSIEKSKNVYAETKLIESASFLNRTDFSELSDEYKNFLTLLGNAISKKYIDLSNISGFGLDILLLNFYDEIKGLCFDEYELSFDNILYLLNQTLYEDKEALKKPESSFLDLVEGVSVDDANQENRKVKITIPVHSDIVEYDVNKAEKYLSIDAILNGKKKCGVMIVSTDNGFSLFVSNQERKMGGLKKPSFVINFSDNQIKIMTIDAEISKRENRSFETVISFDGEFMRFVSSDSSIKNNKRNKNVNLVASGASMQ